MILAFLMFSSTAQAEISTKERVEHFAKGSVKVLFAALNCVALKYASEGVYDELKTLNIAHIISREKIIWARKETFCLSVSIPSLAYVAYRSLKSSIYSFKKAFEKETVIKRSSF